jgi:hypothetical protein
MLGYASYQDIKTREVHDMVWIIPTTLGLIIAAYELYIGDLTIIHTLISIGLMLILSGILWYLSLFGEADLIAFVTLAVIHPRTPLYGFLGYTPIIFSFTLITNAALSGLLTAFYTLGVNLAESLRGNKLFERYREVSSLKRLVVMFSGRNISIEMLRGPPFEYPLEVKGELILKPNLFDDEEAVNAFNLLREAGAKRIWVSATLPYILVLFVGYLISTIYGDVMFTIMSTYM